jgi:hypothetical protein
MKKLIIIFLIIWIGSAFADPLPNLDLTPGEARKDLTVKQICNTKWGKDHRSVTQSMKNKVFEAYGYFNHNKDKRCPCEIDHLISRELGGADTIANLWPQSYTGEWNARMKDRLENRLHKEVCSNNLYLLDAQEGIVKDWTEL